jgi:ubiquinone/menaquinone biosynthesis C-methylase UbiE
MATEVSARTLDRTDLERQVKDMYTRVANEPAGEFHFEMGRALAERLGYPAADLDRIPREAVESFAGVGYYFDLAAIRPGERVVDLGSGSGMDTFLAAVATGPAGHVDGVDMTEAQRGKAERLGSRDGFTQVRFHKGYIEALPFGDGSCDVVISNGVINLSADKAAVFAEVTRVLRPGGRLALADIVSEQALPEGVTCNATLWAACIGGAAQRDQYQSWITGAGLRVASVRENAQYRFLTDQAQNATRKWGVKSISLLAIKP